jgi:hypothetical protein
MTRRRGSLYTFARTINTLSVLASGNPRRIKRRVKNIIVGRALGKIGFWRWLWK